MFGGSSVHRERVWCSHERVLRGSALRAYGKRRCDDVFGHSDMRRNVRGRIELYGRVQRRRIVQLLRRRVQLERVHGRDHDVPRWTCRVSRIVLKFMKDGLVLWALGHGGDGNGHYTFGHTVDGGRDATQDD